jgi:anaerobic magnesium-protoporphyrin IX monomethyl ester cyclase
MSIVFIRPSDPVRLPRGTLTIRPLGLMSMMAVLRSIGIQADLIDLYVPGRAERDIIDQVRHGNYRLFGISCTSYTRFSAVSIANLLKTYFPERPVIAGGPHFSKCAEDALKRVPSIDIIVRGEGEGIVKELVPALLNGGDWRHLDGISFREGSRIRHNPDAKPVRDLDSLPIFNQFAREDYPETLALHWENGKPVPAVAMETSRGCPNRCLFCSAAIPSYRVRSPESVVDEMEMWMDLFPEVRGFNFMDLTLTANRSHLVGLCEEILSRNLEVMWWGESRVDIDPDVLDIMYAAGCRGLSVGVESGSPRVLSAIRKNISLEQVHDFAAKCDSLGMWLDLFLMFSLPTETLDDLKMTLDLIKEMLKKHKKVLYPGGGGTVTSIHPGSQAEAMARQRGVIPQDFSWHEPFFEPRNADLLCSPYVPIYLENLSRSDLAAAVWKSNHWIRTKYEGRYARYKHLIRALFSPDKSSGAKARKVWKRFQTFVSRF